MKIFIFLVFLVTVSHFSLAEVTGHAFLEDQTNHSGIKIKFIPYSPSAQLDSTYSSTTGYFNITINPGVYTLEYSKEGYLTQFYNQGNYITLSGNEFLAPITLIASSGNYLSGSVSGTWTNEVIYYIVGDVYVSSGNSLIIEEGTVIKFFSNCNFEVNGSLSVNGSEENPVLFTTDNNYPIPGSWGYLEFNNTDNSLINNCIIECGSYIEIYQSDLVVTNCEIRKFSIGTFCSHSSPVFDQCKFQQCYEYFIRFSNCNNFIFVKNQLIADQFNIGFRGIDIFDAHGLIENNKFVRGSITNDDNYAIYIDNLNGWDTLFIYNNLIYYFKYGIYSLYNDKVVIINNVINSNSNYGIRIPFGRALIQSNCITNNFAGIESLGNYPNIEISYNNIWNNQTNLTTNIPGLGQIVTTNNNGDPSDPYFNIFLDPLFVDITNFDFHVYESSPVIDAGDNDNIFSQYDFAGNPRILDGNGDGNAIVDMGIFESVITSFPSSSFICPEIVCMNENVNIQYIGTASPDAIYNWDFNEGIIVNGIGQGPYQVYWPQAGDKSVSLYVIEGGQYSDTTYHNIEILQAPEQAGTPQGPNELCQGTQNVAYTTSGALYAASYHWDVDPIDAVSSITGTATTAIIDWNPNYYGLAFISVYGINDCPNGIVSESLEVHLQQKAIVSLTILASSNPVCNGDEVTFFAFPINGGDNPTFQWQINGLNVGYNGPVLITSELEDNDQVYCYLTSSEACVVQGWDISNIIIMDVYDFPTVNIEASPNDTVCITETITLNAGNSGDNYLWSTGQTSHYIVVLNTSGPSGGLQTYWVQVTKGGICSDSDTISVYFDPCTGIEELTGGACIDIFPNPSNEVVYIRMKDLKNEIKITLLSSQGIILEELNFKPIESKYPFKVNLAKYPNGIYFLKFQNEEVFEMRKIIKD